MNNKATVYSFNTELYKVTGIQKVLTDIHNGIKEEYDAKIVGTINYNSIDQNLNIKKNEYIKLKNPFVFKNAVVFIHERKLTTVFVLMNILLHLKMRIIYVHHNIYKKGRIFTLMPRNVVAISGKVKENLLSYFKVPSIRITTIPNGVRDICPEPRKYQRGDKIRILNPARINSVKRQVEIVKQLKGRLSDNIEILFAGIGPNLDELIAVAKDNIQFKVLGFVSDVPKLMRECDYILLFSLHEGLPITLIEGAMCGIPLISNDVGGSLEIVHNGENGFVVNEWDELITTLNSLSEISLEEYQKMCNGSRNIYEEKYKYEFMVGKYLDLISSVQ